MLWLTVWFMVILKIPILYLAWVIWWAVKDPPEAFADGPEAGALGGDGGPGRRPTLHRDRTGKPRGGPHGSPLRRPAPAPLPRTHARAS